MLVVLARRWRPRTLLIVGLVLISLASFLMVAQHFALESMPAEDREAMMGKMFAPPPEVVAATIENYRGIFLLRVPDTAGDALMFQIMQTVFLAPRNIGVMMCGMALYKMGFFTLGWSFIRYVIVGVIALAVGLVGSHYSTTHMLAVNFDIMELWTAQLAQYWGSLPHSLGYAALVMAICKIPFLSLLRMPFAAAGRMALSNY